MLSLERKAANYCALKRLQTPPTLYQLFTDYTDVE
jgi:hypothetical protein